MPGEEEAKVLAVDLVETTVWVIKFPRKKNKVKKRMHSIFNNFDIL